MFSTFKCEAICLMAEAWMKLTQLNNDLKQFSVDWSTVVNNGGSQGIIYLHFTSAILFYDTNCLHVLLHYGISLVVSTFSSRLATPSSTSFLQYIHCPSSACAHLSTAL